MESLKYITRGMVKPFDMQKVYFTAHKDDYHLLDDIAKDILSIIDVAIFYGESENKSDDLKLMKLLVIPVTRNFLYEENDARLKDLKFALENNIPVLPLIQEVGLELEFNKLCGDIQCLNKYNLDKTQISFNKKLEDYLNNIFINDDLRRKIESSFTHNFFLSYRKKDRYEAQKVMNKIHEHKELQGCSIWYDEFLIPGEDYSDNIESRIKNCSLFVMVVTPSLLEENNYIVNVEYPLAIKYNKPIIVIEAQKTSHTELSKMYKDIPEFFDINDKEEVNNLVTKLGIKEVDDLDKKYLLALGYLYGEGVEINPSRAIEYLTSLSNLNHIDSMIMLSKIYYEGKYTSKNTDEALSLIKKVTPLAKMNYSRNKTNDNFMKMINALDAQGNYMKKLKILDGSKAPYLIMNVECMMARKVLDESFVDKYYAYSFECMGDVDYRIQKYEEAKANHEKAYDILVKKVNDNFLNITRLCEKLSRDNDFLGNNEMMKKYQETRVATLEMLLREEESFEVQKTYYLSLCDLADVYYKEGDYPKAIQILKQSIDGFKMIYAHSHMKDSEVHCFFDSAPANITLAKIYTYQGKFNEAKEIYDVLLNNYQILFENNLSLIQEVLSDINNGYGNILFEEKDYENAYLRFKESLIVEKDYILRKAPNDIRKLVYLYQCICRPLFALDKVNEAEIYLNKALILVKNFLQEDNIENLRTLYAVNTLSAEIYKHKGNNEVVEKCLRNCVGICMKINKSNSTNMNRFIDLINSIVALASFYESVGNKEKEMGLLFDGFQLLMTNFTDTLDVVLLERKMFISKNLLAYYKKEHPKYPWFIECAVKSTEALYKLKKDKNIYYSLGDLYFMKATINLEEIDISLLEKSKNIYLEAYQETKDQAYLERANAIKNILKI